MTSADLDINRKFSTEEYFALLDQSEDRYEFHDGEIRMMAGGTDNHSKIKGDLNAFLTISARSGPCEPYDSDMAVSVPRWNSYVFPDLSFVCEEAKFGDKGRRRLLNPSLLIESNIRDQRRLRPGRKIPEVPFARQLQRMYAHRFSSLCRRMLV